MLHLCNDKTKIEQVLFGTCPVDCIGIRMKMRALYKAYGIVYPFCSYYLSEDGNAAAVLYHSTLFFSDMLHRSLAWEDSLSVLPVHTISTDTTLDLIGFFEKQGTFFQKENQNLAPCDVVVESGNIEAAYQILKKVFPETFCNGSKTEQKDFYMDWYCEMSHRIRRGLTDVVVLQNKATASVFCIEDDAIFLSQIGVLSELRGGGYGKKMLAAIMQKYAGKTCYVFSKNPNADKFYHALGFVPVGSWQDYIRKD